MVKTPHLKDKIQVKNFQELYEYSRKIYRQKNKRKEHCILAWDFRFFLNQTFKVAVQVKRYYIRCPKRLIRNRANMNPALIALTLFSNFPSFQMSHFHIHLMTLQHFFPYHINNFLRRTNCGQERDRPSGASLGHFTILIVLSLIHD